MFVTIRYIVFQKLITKIWLSTKGKMLNYIMIFEIIDVFYTKLLKDTSEKFYIIFRKRKEGLRCINKYL